MIPKIRLENLRGLIQTFFFRKKHAPSFEEKGVKESAELNNQGTLIKTSVPRILFEILLYGDEYAYSSRTPYYRGSCRL